MIASRLLNKFGLFNFCVQTRNSRIFFLFVYNVRQRFVYFFFIRSAVVMMRSTHYNHEKRKGEERKLQLLKKSESFFRLELLNTHFRENKKRIE